MVIFYYFVRRGTAERVRCRVEYRQHGILEGVVVFQVKDFHAFVLSLITADASTVRVKRFVVSKPVSDRLGFGFAVFLPTKHIFFKPSGHHAGRQFLRI